jgi:hypothetical protein
MQASRTPIDHACGPMAAGADKNRLRLTNVQRDEGEPILASKVSRRAPPPANRLDTLDTTFNRPDMRRVDQPSYRPEGFVDVGLSGRAGRGAHVTASVARSTLQPGPSVASRAVHALSRAA